MRQIAQRSILLQDNMPLQAEGGLVGDVSKVLKAALKAWDQKRYDTSNGFRYGKGNGMYKRARVTLREEATWNPKPIQPKVKAFRVKAKPIKVPRLKKEAEVKPRLSDEEKNARKQAAHAARLERQRARRAQQTPEAKEAKLQARREAYIAKNGPLKNPWLKKPGTELTPEQKEARRQRVAAYSAAWRARMTPEEKAEYLRSKAEKKRMKNANRN